MIYGLTHLHRVIFHLKGGCNFLKSNVKCPGAKTDKCCHQALHWYTKAFDRHIKRATVAAFSSGLKCKCSKKLVANRYPTSLEMAVQQAEEKSHPAGAKKRVPNFNLSYRRHAWRTDKYFRIRPQARIQLKEKSCLVPRKLVSQMIMVIADVCYKSKQTRDIQRSSNTCIRDSIIEYT